MQYKHTQTDTTIHSTDQTRTDKPTDIYLQTTTRLIRQQTNNQIITDNDAIIQTHTYKQRADTTNQTTINMRTYNEALTTIHTEIYENNANNQADTHTHAITHALTCRSPINHRQTNHPSIAHILKDNKTHTETQSDRHAETYSVTTTTIQ